VEELMKTTVSSLIRNVIIYKGHEHADTLGPYAANITKQIEMFNVLNPYRERCGRPPWKVTSVNGENLIDALQESNPKETLLVIPAGQSSNLDRVFSEKQTSFIRNKFMGEGGGRLYATCGASYMVSRVREYNGLCTEQPDRRELIVKHSTFPLFEGTAKGPLCPYPGKKYQVGYYSDAVGVTNGQDVCTIYLSGGGSFFPHGSAQKVKVLVKYLDSELLRLGKQPHECKNWENATILARVGEGAALLSMFHPYYGSQDIDVESYERVFPDCGTNWKAVHARLSSLDERMNFVLKSMLFPLEDLKWRSD
jgi:glutamine amidotransferase-like uncharacterized protein